MTESTRKMITFNKEMTEDLAFLLEAKKKEQAKERKKGQLHETHVIAELLHQARVVKEAWG